MASSSRVSNILLIFTLACLGAVLVAVPPFIASQMETISRLGETWVYVYLAAVGTGGAILAGVTLWIGWKLWARSRGKREKLQRTAKSPSQLSAAEQSREVEQNLEAIEELRGEAELNDEFRSELEPLLDRFVEKRAAEKLEIVAFGTISSGKSSLLNALAGSDLFRTDVKGGTTTSRSEIAWTELDKVSLVDTPGLGEIEGAEHAREAASAARNADVVLLVVDGPLRHDEHLLLEQLGGMEKRVLICLNKGDWYDSDQQQRLLGQLREQAKSHVQAQDCIAVRSRPTERVRMRITADGEEVEEHVAVEPNIEPLADRLMAITRRDGRSLLMANLLLQSRGLVEEARSQAQLALDRRAWAVVDRYMWGAGGAAAVNPIPWVDVVAGIAISTKMVVDLGRVYRQEIDLQSAAKLLGELGKNLIAILGVNYLAAPAAGAAIGSMLKSVPIAGTIAGGVLQGAVQALITRWIGAVFIVYFKNEMQQPISSLADVARREWERMTSVAELSKLLKEARNQLGKRTKQE